MYLILGIGNPGEKYNGTRHNIGFLVIDKILEKLEKDNLRYKSKFKGNYIKDEIYGEEVIFLKPDTYVNNSGYALKDYISYFKIPENNVIVIYDDIDTKPGEIRIRKTGSSGGHNGLKSILMHIHQFTRIRVGIGKENQFGDRINHVLSRPKGEELENFNKGIERAADAVLDIFKIGVDKTMNKYNKREKTKLKEKKQEENELDKENKIEENTFKNIDE